MYNLGNISSNTVIMGGAEENKVTTFRIEILAAFHRSATLIPHTLSMKMVF